MSDLQSRYDTAVAILNEHNRAIVGPDVGWDGEPPEGCFSTQEFLKLLKQSGGTTVERLAKMSAEDVLQCLRNPVGAFVRPMPLAKDLVKALRGTVETNDLGIPRSAYGSGTPQNAQDSVQHVSGKKADKMTPGQLISAYDATEPANAVGNRLKSMSKGEPFLVFMSGCTVDVAASLKLLLEIKAGFTGREHYDDRPTYRVGERPDAYADENPIFAGRPLRPDGTCDQTNRSWEGVPLEVRQLVLLAFDECGIDATIETAHNMIDIAVSPDAAKKLRKRYPKASIEFNKLAGTGDLPKLKIALTTRKELAAGRPFDGGQKVKVVKVPVPVPVGTTTDNVHRGRGAANLWQHEQRQAVWIVQYGQNNYKAMWRNDN